MPEPFIQCLIAFAVLWHLGFDPLASAVLSDVATFPDFDALVNTRRSVTHSVLLYLATVALSRPSELP